VDPQVSRYRKSRVQFKRIRNWRNKLARKEVLAVVNKLLDQVTQLLAKPPFFLLFLPHMFSFPYRRKGFPPLQQDTILYLLLYPLLHHHFLQSTIHLSLSHHAYSPSFLSYLLLPQCEISGRNSSSLFFSPSPSPTTLKNSLSFPLTLISLPPIK